jgi:hypothetical protein
MDCTVENWWGQELILNCKLGNDAVCDRDKIQKFVDDLVETIEMEKHGDAIITHFGTGELAGYTLVQLIKTSSIVFHFCDTSKNFYGNIFSCKKFSSEKAKECIKWWFDPSSIEELTLNRGI